MAALQRAVATPTLKPRTPPAKPKPPAPTTGVIHSPTTGVIHTPTTGVIHSPGTGGSGVVHGGN